ncbi:DUF2911 domain-containing protein [uncultured Dokdonia sp.]|uniref:DUF2911 domain-containing protein n=1 Tax=uncultured Dokdonia sp. TaxID=575653 RepID=UPI002633BEFB|nr:DUF2911 domain-containing protein [uncultured Dokdonia sp.]
MKHIQPWIACAIICFFVFSIDSIAQIKTPATSQKATVSQTVGISDITITYSRPSVRGRKIWGTPLAHYGFQNLGFGTSTAAPWRAGADENTVITLSNDATVEGKPIKAGTYGLHIALAEDNTATIIFSNTSTSWGSYFYDEKEDALRVKVTTKEIEHTELLTYQFTAVDVNSATVALQWEKKAIPFKIEFDVTSIVMNDISNTLRDGKGFNRLAWENAAQYAFSVGNMEKALDWINNAQSGWFFSQKTFNNAQIKSAILNQMGKPEEAMAEMESVLDQATVLEAHQYGRQLIATKNLEQAEKVFKENAKKNNNIWPTQYGLGRVYSAKGDYKTAIKYLEKALKNAPNPASKANVQANIDMLKKGEDIN